MCVVVGKVIGWNDVKRFRGTFRKDRELTNVPAYSTDFNQEPPGTLSENAKDIWRAVVPDVIETGIV